jgi:hypothetical protein
VKLIVCWGTWTSFDHPCGLAHTALVESGYRPNVVHALGTKHLPDLLNLTPGRRRAKELTDSTAVPVLELDDGTVVAGSEAIITWARDNTVPR